jgi:pilus assembly protein CpaC
LEELLPRNKIELEAVSNTIVLKGDAASAKESADAVAVAQRFVEKPENVINMMRILSDMQILMQVRVAEVQRNVVKNLAAATGFNREVLPERNLQFRTSGGSAFSTAVTGSLMLNYMGLTNINFSALETQGLVKTLAEPVLTAISGETANFLAGGEYPAPSGIDSNGNLIIQFREFGVGLSFTPVILSDNRISLRISTEVSRLAQENRLDLPFNDTTVPVLGLTVRRAASTVNLPSGGSLMIAGLIQNDEFNSISGVPGLKDVPILGALFRSQQFQRNETELVVLLQAFQVRTIDPGQTLAAPTDGFVPASDFDIYFMGRLHKHYSKGSALDQIPRLEGPYGYIME